MRNIPTSVRNPHRLMDAAIDSWEEKDPVPVFGFKEISLSETKKPIAGMGNSAAMGHNTIDSLGIKGATEELGEPLQHIINTSLRNGKFSMKWKFAKLTPILKGKELDKSSVSSYRPVAVLPTVSKLVELVAQLQLLGFLEDSRQINPSTHAYRSNYSTTTTLCEIMDNIYQGPEDKLITSVMTLDLSSAFDMVDHDLLLEKLVRYRIGAEARGWIQDYLQYITQYVMLGRAKSRMQAVRRGIPQGSVIGPLLYAIFVKGLYLVSYFNSGWHFSQTIHAKYQKLSIRHHSWHPHKCSKFHQHQCMHACTAHKKVLKNPVKLAFILNYTC